jgi:hypothetical protein
VSVVTLSTYDNDNLVGILLFGYLYLPTVIFLTVKGISLPMPLEMHRPLSPLAQQLTLSIASR